MLLKKFTCVVIVFLSKPTMPNVKNIRKCNNRSVLILSFENKYLNIFCCEWETITKSRKWITMRKNCFVLARNGYPVLSKYFLNILCPNDIKNVEGGNCTKKSAWKCVLCVRFVADKCTYIYREPQFMSPCRNCDSPNPSPAGECALPRRTKGWGGGGTLACG